MTDKFPTLYDVYNNGEATGLVYHFCREDCLILFLVNHPGLTVEAGLDGPAEVIFGEVCTQCGEPLANKETTP